MNIVKCDVCGKEFDLDNPEELGLFLADLICCKDCVDKVN